MTYIIGALVFTLCLAGGLFGGRRIAGSITAPLILTILQIASSHSELYALPPSTAVTSVFGWLAGFTIWLLRMRDRDRPVVDSDEAEHPVANQ